jgi:hypothetical protein
MPDGKDQIISRLADEGAKAAEYFRALPSAAWEQQVYATGGLWRVREVLSHFVSTEATILKYGGDILNGGPGAPEGFVIDEYNETQVGGMAGRDPAGLIAEFEALREETIAMVRGMEASDFERVGRHPWFGLAPLEEMLKLVYRHTMLHIRDIKRALETGRPAEHRDVTPPSEKGKSRKAEIRNFLQARHTESMAVLSDMTEADLAKPVYSSEAVQWTVRDVIAHLADSDRGQLGQIQRLVKGEQTIPVDFDLDRWNKRAVQKRADKPVADLLADIEKAHADALHFLEGLSDADLDKAGRHPRGDEPTAEGFFSHMAQHRASHAAEIKAAIAK